jgi:2-C-methyl-D-erythritol 4-phosphate cytidylyltransferase/2-C-methyl-D-erythritol 2,4-cyclodiphosphate synthase
MKSYKTICLIAAAGSGKRAGGKLPKQYMHIGGVPMLRRTALAFLNHPQIDGVRIIYNESDKDLYDTGVGDLDLLPPVAGGILRQDSVRIGLASLKEFSPHKVLIHDAARPFVSANIISGIINALDKHKAAIPAVAVEDTLKKCADGKILQTVSRENLMQAQTPQGFLYEEILGAHNEVVGESFTDDAAIYEHLGRSVFIIEGEKANFKVTTNEDFQRANNIMSETRIGTGFDVHKFCAPKSDNNTIMLCGIAIPFEKSLEGHSDADVGIHAIVDAILGAIGEGDIGVHFPPSETKWKGADSRIFLEHARDLVANKGATIINIDTTIICERPKLQDYKQQMAENIANILRIDASRVSVKATTTEGLGFTGRGEGIAAQAVCSVRVQG